MSFSSGKARLQRFAWSPMGISDAGEPLLAIAVHSNDNLLFKILGYRHLFPKLQFFERDSLNELLRSNWLSIPLFAPERTVITAKYPSISMCFEPLCPRGSVAWLPAPFVSSVGMLAIGCGDVAFLVMVSPESVQVLACFSPKEAEMQANPISSLSLSNRADDRQMVLLAMTLFNGTVCTFDISFECSVEGVPAGVRSCSLQSSEAFLTPSLAKSIGYKGLNSSSAGEGVCLGACSSPNGAYDYVAKRTSRCIELMRRVAVSSIEGALIRLLESAKDLSKPLLDLVYAITQLYRREHHLDTSKLAAIDPKDPLHGIVERLVRQSASEHITKTISQLPMDIRSQISFGLHHLHSTIDPVAGTHRRARIAERKALLAAVRGGENILNVRCPLCDEAARIDEDGTRGKCVYGHGFAVCALSGQPAQPQAVSCNFCSSINISQTRAKDVCQVCRIGLASRLNM